ncbi:malectin domain-containing carbohydrate-binding protein [Catellatospora vulcania]|uniref:malectin domain-containing carbohydrate-binding protein n=1 Tax=Catellatospora vulcania TaxID=1460450 RepID=UPI0012D48088|nr:malectin domain-containing carbohydrate-binding protein [Catellatospora vulcania]
MPDRSTLTRRVLAALTAVAVTAVGLTAAGPATAAPDHTTVVTAVPSAASPDIKNGTVYAVHDAGTKIIAAGDFTTVRNRGSEVDITRNYILAFDKATGTVDTAFAPTVSDEVSAVIAGPTAGTVFIAGKFNTVNGVTRRKVALLNVSTGALVTGFAGPAFNGAVKDIALAGSRLLVGGIFTNAGNATLARGGLASVNASTGALDSYLTTSLTENHNYDGVSGASAGVGATKLALSPNGQQLVVIGNFKKANGVLHDQIVKLDLGASAAVADWNTSRYTPRCAWWAFDSYMRDLAYSPDGSYFVVVTTGAPNSGTLCDAAARWENAATGTELQPTWVDYAGGDTLLSVGISEQAVYVGGHIRWLNNSFGGDSAGPGAVGRASIAALDPLNGLPMSWNPGRHPRGVGVAEILVTPAGVWLGSDTQWIGNYQYRRERIAFFSTAGGNAPHATTTATLPGNVYQAGVPVPTNVLYRINAGGSAVAASDGGPDWAADDSGPSAYHNNVSNTAGYGTVPSVDSTVPAGTPAALYSSERWDSGGAPEMSWQFPVPVGTEVEVRLYLANRYDGTASPGSRVFNVALDGTTVLANLDLSGAVGHNVGTMRSFTVVSDGSVDLDFGHVVENPLINGIEIVKTGPPPAGNGDEAQVRSYDGATTVGAASAVANPDSTAWSTARGGFWVGGTLFYGMNGALWRRTFNGSAFGTAALVDPYHDAYWDTVESGTDSPTYAGVTPDFYAEIPNVSAMFYNAGRVYYTLVGQSGLHWRWFTPDSGVVGAEKFTVAGVGGMGDAGGLFLAGSTLYKVNRSTGELAATAWAGGLPTGSFTLRSGPSVDGVDWRAKVVFVGP